MHNVVLNASQPDWTLDLLEEGLHVMHIYDMISKLRVSAHNVEHELASQAQDTTLRPLNWRRKTAVPLKRRRAIDISRPAWVVEDRVMEYVIIIPQSIFLTFVHLVSSPQWNLQILSRAGYEQPKLFSAQAKKFLIYRCLSKNGCMHLRRARDLEMPMFQ